MLCCIIVDTVCPRSLGQFDIVSYYIKLVKTSWTYRSPIQELCLYLSFSVGLSFFTFRLSYGQFFFSIKILYKLTLKLIENFFSPRLIITVISNVVPCHISCITKTRMWYERYQVDIRVADPDRYVGKDRIRIRSELLNSINVFLSVFIANN